MSTNGNIILKVRREDIGTHKTFSQDNFPIDINGKEKCDLGGWGLSNTLDKLKSDEGVDIEHEYLSVYLNFSRIHDNMDETLVKVWNTYESVLNMILGGDISSITTTRVTNYANRRENCTWKHIQPKQGESMEEVSKTWRSYYTYYFDGEQWWYCENKDFDNMKLLSEYTKPER